LVRKKVSVFVAGSWGTALACVLAANGHDVMIWSRNAEQVDEINEQHRNYKFLKNHPLHTNVKATTSMEVAAFQADAVLLAAPTSAMRQVTHQLQPYLTADTLVIHAAKGFETGSLFPMSKVIAEELPQIDAERIVVLSGPSHAEEVIVQCPTTIVVAAASMEAAQMAQDLLINNDFRVYTNVDILGVELAGALKNIIAIGSGMVDGLSFGDNAKAALITRGLAEITRLGVTMGANPLTFSGLAGVGDLIVTCTSQHSRNWRAGYQIAQGKAVKEVLDEMGMVVEGVKTTNAAMALSRQYDVAMPITEQLYLVLFEGKDPKLAVEDLMGRGRTQEDIIAPFEK
jgi:glycerol-3-phosphate dehydrogenase (NAD(P)+)